MRKTISFLIAVSALGVACLTRPVTSQNPTTNEVIDKAIKQQTVDKVDLLFMIDNSSSMGDKQDLLADAVPLLVNRLVAPNCVADDGTTSPSTNGACAAGTKIEFPPVKDMHIGIVSSSLGAGGAPDAFCSDSVTNPWDPSVSAHTNDAAHLLTRTAPPNATSPEGTVADAAGGFLAWLPPASNQQTLVTDFQSLVTGVQEYGCGLEAQLESFYRFLIQPDPWQSISVAASGSTDGVALQGIDAELLKERHDFLRPDSLLAVIVLTDEEDSWSDPMWGQGHGWFARTQNTAPFGGPGNGAGPLPTSECAANPNDPNCTSCALQGNKPNGEPIASDPNCNACAGGQATCPKNGWYTPASGDVNAPIAAVDGINVRYTDDMKRRYGFNPQFSIQRYVDGLSKSNVPDRDHEAHDMSAYGSQQANCTNPLFAASLPDGSDTSPEALCNLPVGTRTQDLTFYAIIGGVPNDLLYTNGDPQNGQFKLDLSDDDWTKLIGKDPASFDQTGIDPHMIESTSARAGVSSGEWNTLTSNAFIDLEYACTFDLPVAKDCTDPEFANACDCEKTAATDPNGPPLCDPVTKTKQVRGKAYPTIRELRVAKGLGKQAVVASLCAHDTAPADKALPGYGYNDAMQAIVNRLKQVLEPQCLPQALDVQSDCTVPCQVLEVDSTQTDQSAACTDPGLSQPDADTLARFRASYLASLGDSGASAPVPTLCVLAQLAPATLAGSTCANASPGYSGASCAQDPAAGPGFCYVTGAAAGACETQAIQFSAQGAPKNGRTIQLQCIEASQ